MPSPFHGMDPYLESPEAWSDFHGTFLMSIRAELNRVLPSPYVARWDRYIWIDEPAEEQPRRLGKPDVYVADRLGRETEENGGGGLAAPATVTMPAVEADGKPYLKIIDTRGHRVVSVIELLSPANKIAGRDRDAYLAKRQEYLRTRTNLVEMDLLRAGLRAPVEEPLPPADYYILVSRGVDYPRAGVWPFTVRDALPDLRVPLDSPVPAVELPLRPCFDRTYDEARFGDEIDYDQPPTPPLREPDASWARDLLARRPRP